MSHEFRVSSPAEYRLRGTAGLFYQRQSDKIRAGFDLPNLPVYYEVAGQQNVYYLSQMTRTDRDYAAFGEPTFDVTDQLKVVGGIREFWVNNTLGRLFRLQRQRVFHPQRRGTVSAGRQSHRNHPGVYTGGPQPCNNTNKKVVEHGETHRVSLQYQITPSPHGLLHVVHGISARRQQPPTDGERLRCGHAHQFRARLEDRLVRSPPALKRCGVLRKMVRRADRGAGPIRHHIHRQCRKCQGGGPRIGAGVGCHGASDRVRRGYGPLAHGDDVGFLRPTKQGVEQSTCTSDFVDAYPGTQLPGTPKVKSTAPPGIRSMSASIRVMCRGSVNHQSSTTYSLEVDAHLCG